MRKQNQTKIDRGNGQVITATLKRNAFNIFVEPENNLWTYDLSGRIVGVYYHSRNYRRTLDNTFHLKTREFIAGEDYRVVEIVCETLARKIVQTGIDLSMELSEILPERYMPVLEKILTMDFDRLKMDGDRFKNIYLPISILPPDQYLSLVVQITEGCNYNKCTFCDFYRDRPFRIKTENEVVQHLKDLKTFFGDGLSIRNSVFLADANAIVTPMAKLKRSLELIIKEFSEITTIYSFIDVFTGLKKTVDDFKELKRLGLQRVYLGVESGHPSLLEFLKKPQDLDAIVELTKTLRIAGINIGVIFLVGTGGKRFEFQHRKDSITLLEKLDLGQGDIVYISEFNETNREYTDSMKESRLELPDRTEIRQWTRTFKKEAKKAVNKDVKVAVYDIKQFFY